MCVCVCFRSDNKVTVHFINRDGEKITVKGSPGDSLLDLVINEDLDFDGFGTKHTHTHTHTHTYTALSVRIIAGR